MEIASTAGLGTSVSAWLPAGGAGSWLTGCGS